MAVYFVCRCHCMGPSKKYVKRFDDATVLDWFRRHWIGCDLEESWDYVKDILGQEVHGFDNLFRAIREHELEPPRSGAGSCTTSRGVPLRGGRGHLPAARPSDADRR